jgi:predicted DNA-binding protein
MTTDESAAAARPLRRQFQVICSDEMDDALSAAARRYGVSKAVLVRECVTYGLAAVVDVHARLESVRSSVAGERVA